MCSQEYTTSLTLNNDYVRKHNPLIQYDSVTNNAQRAANIKNFTLFYQDLASDKLPQYMFITPNVCNSEGRGLELQLTMYHQMTNDGHDSSITTAGEWARSFLEPLMNNTNFMRRTLVLLTFDESETYTTKNNVFAMLLGDAIPKSLVGTTDDSFYMHYRYSLERCIPPYTLRLTPPKSTRHRRSELGSSPPRPLGRGRERLLLRRRKNW